MRRIDESLIKTLIKARRGFPVPACYRHILILDTELFKMFWREGTIDFEYFDIDNLINYKESDGVIQLSFVTVKVCNEVHIKMLEHIMINCMGSLPVIRTESEIKKPKNNIDNGNRSE